MINYNNMMLSLDDVAIEAAVTSDSNSRKLCNVRYEDGMLPIFTSPMPCVVNLETAQRYKDAGIIPIIPRGDGNGDEWRLRYELSFDMWVAFSLDEFEKVWCADRELEHPDAKQYVLIDMANGHVRRLGNAISKAKSKNPNLVIMAGNVAHPKTYEWLSDCGADYVRLSVGTGSACTTATQTGLFYGMATLIDNANKLKNERLTAINEGIPNLKPLAKIIADGGIKNKRHAYRALALGADYIMLGGALNSCVDSAGEIVLYNDRRMKEYYGMASRLGAEKLGKNSAYPEGKIRYNEIGGTIKEFADSFENIFRSTMTYCNGNSLETFIGKQILNPMSPSCSQSYNQSTI